MSQKISNAEIKKKSLWYVLASYGCTNLKQIKSRNVSDEDIYSLRCSFECGFKEALRKIGFVERGKNFIHEK